jgi:hypothetical protein
MKTNDSITNVGIKQAGVVKEKFENKFLKFTPPERLIAGADRLGSPSKV